MSTKSEMIEQLDVFDHEISELEEIEVQDAPPHDLYRAILFGYCIDCGHRYVDMSEGQVCNFCRPVTDWIKKYRDVHPWASD